MGTMIDLKNRYEVLMKKNQNLSFRVSELEEEKFKLKKDMSLMEEGLQAEILVKDKEIGRLMKKVNDKR
jgi:predicted RNase H-like nuclease (RuvC/YqgF family)